MNIEQAFLAINHALYEDLPAFLDLYSEEPFRWLERHEDGSGFHWETLTIKLPPPEEIWSEQRETMNYPALILYYQNSSETPTSDECPEKDVTVTLLLDVILTWRNPEALTFLWLRYLEAIKHLLHSKNFPFAVQTPSQVKSEQGPFDSLYMRRGLLEINISFEE